MAAAGGFRCAACRCQQPAIKRLALRRCPTVLMLSLKRFAFTSMTFASCVKDITAVWLPPDSLSLTEFCSGNLSVAGQAPDEPVYDLMGLVSHIGSIDGGHYTATVRGAASSAEQSKGHLGGQWYHCNDEHVRVAEMPSSQASSQAYLLLYVRRNYA